MKGRRQEAKLDRQRKKAEGIRTLNTKLVWIVVGNLLLVICLFFIWSKVTVYGIEKKYLNESAANKRTEEKINDFSDYVSEKNIASNDVNAILKWQRQERDVYILVYQNETVIFDSSKQQDISIMQRLINKLSNSNSGGRKLVDSEDEKKEILSKIKNKRLVENYQKSQEAESGDTTETVTTEVTATEAVTTEAVTTEVTATEAVTTEAVTTETATTEASAEVSLPEKDEAELAAQYQNYAFYPVRFADGLYDVCIVDYSEKKVYYISMIIGFLVCMFLYVALIMFYNGRIVRRVRRLTHEVSKIKNDNIQAEITKSGNDEIYILAENIDSMRNSIIHQMSKEEEAWQANRDLVTAMAHDIRTPLTVLNGYLELLQEGAFESDEEYQQYIETCVDKAGQLKDLSDKLFRYFFVYSGHTDKLKMELFDAKELFQQMVGEYIILLEEKGITFHRKTDEASRKIAVDVSYLKRLFDNIFTNIRKYSDYGKPVDVIYEVSEHTVKLVISNYIRKDRNGAESTRIGIKTCEKIAQEMNISFSVKEERRRYTVTLIFTEAEQRRTGKKEPEK